MNGINRAIVGGLGGLAAWLSKLLALDIAMLGQLVDQQLWVQAAELKVNIYIFLPVLIFLGSLIAWMTEEKERFKLFAIGVSAPAILAPWLAKASISEMAMIDRMSIVSPAYAGAVSQDPRGAFSDGFKVLLGITEIPNPAEERYWVIIGSHVDLDRAFLQADDVNRNYPQLKAFVGNRAPGNPFFPVVLGGNEGYLTFKDATKLRNYANSIGISKGSGYLSSYPDRLPFNGPPR